MRNPDFGPISILGFLLLVFIEIGLTGWIWIYFALLNKFTFHNSNDMNINIHININMNIDINIHIVINMNIDIHIIINMNVEDYTRYYLLSIRYSLLGIPYWLFPIGYSI